MTDHLAQIEADAREDNAEFDNLTQSYEIDRNKRILVLVKIVRLQREALIEAIGMHRTNMALFGAPVSCLSCYEDALLESEKILKYLE